MMKRTLYYWARLFTDQLQKSEGYHKLRPTITINICDFTLFTDTENYHNTYHLYEDQSLKPLDKQNDVLEIHFIEMNKFIQAWHANKLDAFADILVRWLLLLGMVDARKQKVYNDILKELEELAMKDERLIEAFNAWEELSQTPDSIIAYHSRLKSIIDQEARLHDATTQGYEQGIEQGEKKVVKKLIAKGLSNEEILEVSDLTFAQIEALRQESP